MNDLTKYTADTTCILCGFQVFDAKKGGFKTRYCFYLKTAAEVAAEEARLAAKFPEDKIRIATGAAAGW